MARKKAKFSVTKEIKKLARERVGKVPPSRVVTPKPKRKSKHELPDEEEQ